MPKMLVLGSNGLLGHHIKRVFRDKYELFCPPSSELDLTNQEQVNRYFDNNKFDIVINAAAKVSGIKNQIEAPYDHGYINQIMILNVINNIRKYKIRHIFISSATIYPLNCSSPLEEDYILSAKLEPAVEMYALAKLMGNKLCNALNKQYNIKCTSVILSNIYGDGYKKDNTNSIAEIVKKFITNIKEESITMRGTGLSKREYLYAGDAALAIEKIIDNDITGEINVGYGSEFMIKDVVAYLKDISGFNGEITWDTSYPDGTQSRLLSTKKIRDCGWYPLFSLYDGLKLTYNWTKNYGI